MKTDTDSGEEEVSNRLMRSVVKRGGRLIVPSKQRVAPVSVVSTDWLEPLAERLERRLAAYKTCSTYAMPLNGDEAFRALLTILAQEFRACAESGSNAADERPAPARKD